MPPFDIEDMQPIGRTAWKATVKISLPESIPGYEVAQVCRLTLRFSLGEDRTVADLLETAYSEARRVLSVLHDTTAENSLEDMRAKTDAWYRSIDPEVLAAEWAEQSRFDPSEVE